MQMNSLILKIPFHILLLYKNVCVTYTDVLIKFHQHQREVRGIVFYAIDISQINIIDITQINMEAQESHENEEKPGRMRSLKIKCKQIHGILINEIG